MSILQTAIASALGTIRTLAGVPVTISDGTHSTPNVNAAVGKTEYTAEQDNQVVETFTSRDYLIARADYKLNGVAVLPAKGHTITEIVNGVSKTFTALAPQGELVFEFSDVGQTQLRIHTKETA
jgi:3-polyprenyl-4-hydroxybenzoate decarboxylase